MSLGGLGPGAGAVTLGRNRPRSDPRARPRPFRVPENSRGRRPSSTAPGRRRGRSSQPSPLGLRDPRIPGPPDSGPHLAPPLPLPLPMLLPPPPPPRQTPPAASAGTGGGASGGIRGAARPSAPQPRGQPHRSGRTRSSLDARPAFAPIKRRCFPRGPASNSTALSDFPLAGPDCLSAFSARTRTSRLARAALARGGGAGAGRPRTPTETAASLPFCACSQQQTQRRRRNKTPDTSLPPDWEGWD